MCRPRYFELNGDDYITISDIDEEKCTVCGGNFKHTMKYIMVEKGDNGLREVIFNTAHKGCLKIMARIKAKRKDITDLEYKIFSKSIV